MARLYAGESTAFDSQRARRAALWLLAHPEAGGTWHIEAEGQAAGYLVVTVCVSLEFEGRFALLDELYLDGPFRGRGLGAQAVEFAAEWARAQGMRALRLEVSPGNVTAQGLYRKCGFLPCRCRLMTRWLR